MNNFNKSVLFENYCEGVQRCTLCERLSSRVKVMSANNGNYDSKVLFVAEAPGRLGADKTLVPLKGDRTGDNFDLLLRNIGWKRNEIFITNAVLCNPRTSLGNNDTPTTQEISNCSVYLRLIINLINPDVIVTLGATALKSLAQIKMHDYTLKQNVSQLVEWNGRSLFPLYHPGPRALVHRNITKQLSDMMKLSGIVHPLNGLKDDNRYRTKSNRQVKEIERFLDTIKAILDYVGCVSYFKLAKLLYMLDIKSIDAFGESFTGELFVRQADGPWPPRLYDAVNLLKTLSMCSITKRKELYVSPGPSLNNDLPFNEEKIKLLYNVLQTYGSMSNTNIKVSAYRSKPMRHILQIEKRGEKTINKPIIYKDKIVAFDG